MEYRIIAARLSDVQIGKSRSCLLFFRICAISAQQIGIRARRFVQICASMASRKSGRSGGDYAITHLDGKRRFCAIWSGGDYVEREECSSLGNLMIRSLLCWRDIWIWELVSALWLDVDVRVLCWFPWEICCLADKVCGRREICLVYRDLD